MTAFLTSRIKRPAVYGFLLSVVLVLSLPMILNRVMNTKIVKNKLSSVIYHKTGMKVDSSRVNLRIFPQTSLTINGFDFYPDNRVQIHINTVQFTMDQAQLLRGRLTINEITVDTPRIKAQSPAQPARLDPMDFSVLAYVRKIKAGIAFLPVHQESIEITINNATAPYFRQMDGRLVLSKKENETRLNTTVKGIRIGAAELSTLGLGSDLDLDTIKIDRLKTSITLTSSGRIKGSVKAMAPEARSKNKTLIASCPIIECSFTGSDAFYEIDVPAIDLDRPKARIGIYFLNDPVQKKSLLRFTGTRVNVHEARQMSQLLFKDNEIVNKLFKILHAGRVPDIDVTFQSEAFEHLLDADNLTLEGNVIDATVHIPETDLVATHINGKARLEKGVLDVQTASATIETSKIEKGSLSVDLLNFIDFPFQGDFLLDVDLSMVPKTLVSLLPDTQLAGELKQVHGLKGRSKTRLTLSMETRSPHLDVGIRTDDFSVTGQYDRIPGPVNLENINLVYDTDKVTLNGLTGTMNAGRVNDLSAVIDFTSDPWFQILSGSGMVTLDKMLPWLSSTKRFKHRVLPIQQADGTLFLTSMALSGPVLNPDKWTYNVKGTGRAINLSTLADQHQIQNMSCRFHATPDRVRLNGMRMTLSDLSPLKNTMGVRHLDHIILPLELTKGQFQTGSAPSFFMGDVNFPTGPCLSVSLKGDSLASLAPDTIKIKDKGFSDAVITFNHDKEHPLFDFRGILTSATLEKLFVADSFPVRKLNDLTEGDPVIVHTDTDNMLHIITKGLNLNALFSRSASKVLSIQHRLLPANLIKLKADKLTIKKLTFTHIDSKISLKKDHSYIKLDSGFLCDLKTSGYLNLKKDIVYAKIPFEAHEKENIQNLLTCLFQKENFMDGRYSLTGNLHSEGNRKDFLTHSTGSFVLAAQDGRIYKLTLLSRILSVLNVSKFFKGKIPDVTQTGFAYRNISIDADIRNGRIYLSRAAVIDGSDMTLIFNGWLDPVNDELDLTCLVAPFKTIDLIVEKIPIVNTLLSGRLVSVPVKASGKLSDPTVIPLHPSAVGKGLVDMMANILQTPVKLWDKLFYGDQEN